MATKYWPIINPTEDVTHIRLDVDYQKCHLGNGVYLYLTPGKQDEFMGRGSWSCWISEMKSTLCLPMERRNQRQIEAAEREIIKSINAKSGKAFEFLEGHLKKWGHEIVLGREDVVTV